MDAGFRILGTMLVSTAVLQPIRSGASLDEIEYVFTFQGLVIAGDPLDSHPESHPFAQLFGVDLFLIAPRAYPSFAFGGLGLFGRLTPDGDSAT